MTHGNASATVLGIFSWVAVWQNIRRTRGGQLAVYPRGSKDNMWAESIFDHIGQLFLLFYPVSLPVEPPADKSVGGTVWPFISEVRTGVR